MKTKELIAFALAGIAAFATIASRGELVMLAPEEGATFQTLTDWQLKVFAGETRQERFDILKDADEKATRKEWRRQRPLVLKWKTTGGEKYPWRILLATKPDFSDARDFWAEKDDIRREKSRDGRDIGTAWCEPYEVEIPSGVLKDGANDLQIEFTNVWANRLIGDEQEPPDCDFANAPRHGGRYLMRFPDWFKAGLAARPSKGRKCFTDWNYFTKDSPLVPSGILGPVRIEFAGIR